MCVALRKDHHIASAQMHRRLIGQLDVTFTFGDQMKYHHPLGTRLEQRGGCCGLRRLIRPGSGELRLDENRTDEAHHPQGLRQSVHQRSSTSTLTSIGSAWLAAIGTGEQA